MNFLNNKQLEMMIAETKIINNLSKGEFLK